MNSNTNRYEIFLKVAEAENITKAAEMLHYTQSGISHAIAALEKEAGFPIFIRTNNGVLLTEQGKELVIPIRNLVNQQRNLAQTISSMNHIVAGTLKLGTFISVSAQWLPDIIKKFSSLYPMVEFEILAGNYDEIYGWIQKGKIDCGFLTETSSGDLSFQPLRRDPLYALLPQKHILASKSSVNLEDLLREEFIIPVKGSDNDIRAVFHEINRVPNIKYTLNDDFSVMSMVANGFGVSIMPELIMKNFKFDLCMIPLEPSQYRNIGIASLQKDQRSLLTKKFIEFMLKEYRE